MNHTDTNNTENLDSNGESQENQATPPVIPGTDHISVSSRHSDDFVKEDKVASYRPARSHTTTD